MEYDSGEDIKLAVNIQSKSFKPQMISIKLQFCCDMRITFGDDRKHKSLTSAEACPQFREHMELIPIEYNLTHSNYLQQ